MEWKSQIKSMRLIIYIVDNVHANSFDQKKKALHCMCSGTIFLPTVILVYF